MKKEVFRVGDYIEIIEPKFVKRVGYPVHPSDFYEDLKKDPNVLEALKLIGISPEWEDESNGSLSLKTSLNVPDELVKAIAFIKTRQQRFGGNTRSIHYYEEDFSEMKNSFFIVHAKKVVKTGERFAPWSGYDGWSGEYDYIPGGLSDEKTHVLLNVIFQHGNKILSNYWIETCNVKKM